MASQAAANRSDQFAQAYRALRSDPSVQFNLPPSPPKPKPPAWLEKLFDAIGSILKPIGRLLEWLGSHLPDGPFARIILWTIIVVGALAIAWVALNRIRHGGWSFRRLRFRADQSGPDEDSWRPAQAEARFWLEEAEALAKQGRFAEAIHHLLLRSVEDIARRRPTLVRPALTSRELASADGIPSRARALFSGIAASVERSLFGGREVGEQDWAAARDAYSEFALAGSWRS